jgi:phosphatidylglycerophosphate synthase
MVTAIHEAKPQAARDVRSRPGWDSLEPTVGQDVPRSSRWALGGILWSLTLGRILLVPIFLVGALRLRNLADVGSETLALRWGLLATLGAIGLSDVLDGWLARGSGLASQAGAVVDALADKLAQVALVAFFTFGAGPAFGSLPLWFFALIVGRDLVLGGGWVTLRARGIPFQVEHRAHGRLATLGVFALLFWLTGGSESAHFDALLLLTAALVWTSAAAYVGEALTAVRRVAEARS